MCVFGWVFCFVLFFGLGFCCCCCFSESAHWSFLELQSQFFLYDVIQAGFLPGQKRYFWKLSLLNAIRAIKCAPPMSFQWRHIAFSLALRQGHERLFPLLPFLHHTDGTCQGWLTQLARAWSTGRRWGRKQEIQGRCYGKTSGSRFANWQGALWRRQAGHIFFLICTSTLLSTKEGNGESKMQILISNCNYSNNGFTF